jgi:hypothetical protein
MKQLLDDSALDALTAVELPDRNLVCDCGCALIVVDFSGWTINVLSFNDIESAIGFCVQFLNGSVISVDDVENTVVCEIGG